MHQSFNNWALSDSSMRSAPKIVQLFTIGEISSTKLQGNSLDNAVYAGLRIAIYTCNQDSC